MQPHTVTESHVEKTEVGAELFLNDGTAMIGSVFVRSVTDTGGVDPILDLLEGADRMIPCRGESGELVFVGRSSIAAIRTAGSPPEYEASELVPMRITVDGGHRFEGVLSLPMGGPARISDLLNSAGPWLLCSDSEADRVVWVASDRMIRSEAP